MKNEKKEKIKKNKKKTSKMRTRQNDATTRTTSNSGKRVLLNDDNYVPTKKKLKLSPNKTMTMLMVISQKILTMK